MLAGTWKAKKKKTIKSMRKFKVIISGGGTGGHIFPAIAIANTLKNVHKDNVEILFVGANGKMEMEKVPQAGYKIEGLNISGFQRKLTIKNLVFPFKLIGSLIKAIRIVKEFKPDVAVGVGGYASGPLLRMATFFKVPAVIQEQNSYPGVTNKILASKVRKICVAYDGMERFFPKEKVVLTGNPVRQNMVQIDGKKDEAMEFFKLDENKPTLLVIGGSLGARTINNSIRESIQILVDKGIQVIWQTGKLYYNDCKKVADKFADKGVRVYDFVQRMDLAYAAADVVVSRAGAISVSELCLVGKPCILVPSPNVAEDHQTKNAMALVNNNAAILVRDADSVSILGGEVVSLLGNKERCNELSLNIKKMGIHNAAEAIVKEIEKVIKD